MPSARVISPLNETIHRREALAPHPLAGAPFDELLAPARFEPLVAPEGPSGAGQPNEHPVFMTHDGRARRRPRWAAGVVSAATTGWIAAVVVGGTGFSSMPALRLAPASPRAFSTRPAGESLEVADRAPRRLRPQARPPRALAQPRPNVT